MSPTEINTTARAFWITGPGRGEIRGETLAAPSSEQVLVEALFSGVSRGTESLVFAGRVPPSEYQRMRAPHQDGDFPFPVKYGYCSVGRVTAGPTELTGKNVFCLYPHQSHYIVHRDSVTVLPANVPPRRAVLTANLETAVNALWDSEVRVGDRVSVIGGGVVGCLVAYLCARIPGCHVELVDIDPARATIAAALGARFSSPHEARTGADVVFHTSGAGAGLKTALAVAGKGATVVELSWYGDRSIEVSLGEAFHSQRLTLRSSQVGTLPPSQGTRWSYSRRLSLALELLADSTLDTLLTGESSLDELPAIMSAITSQPGTLCHSVRYAVATPAS